MERATYLDLYLIWFDRRSGETNELELSSVSFLLLGSFESLLAVGIAFDRARIEVIEEVEGRGVGFRGFRENSKNENVVGDQTNTSSAELEASSSLFSLVDLNVDLAETPLT